ncbi:MAG: preprotein translocase subunit YajC [Sulfurovum sp. AS07-7]|jgi:preprotein translocase subunit YajC|nr:MAG: preprotein translocase subunit YajC [Sulfurovum sp. AS07-7]MBD3795118.1 preprotein translocase subunit YajC [Campylobacterota bacterium]TQV62787.1 MAG: preprotein translocase subunit YajC [Sulfurovum sp.]
MQEVIQFLPLVFLFLIFYFLIIRPQQAQQKAHALMLSELKRGDKIVTSGGLHAEIVKVHENFIEIKLNESSNVRLEKAFVAKKIEEK